MLHTDLCRNLRLQKKESSTPRSSSPVVVQSARDSTVSRFGEHGEYWAISYRPIISSLYCEKIAPTQARGMGQKQGT